MAIREMDGKIITPCIGICKLKDDICIGCKRTIEEIKEAYDKLVNKTYNV
jgi:predicted Fe-S protein YdhL (DUF1289 family)